MIGGPEWINAALYEINAKTSRQLRGPLKGPPRELFLMIRSERFKLEAHTEMRE